MIQQPGYPISGIGLEVHNVFLSHAAELGLPGFLLWLAALLGAIRWAFVPRGWLRRAKTNKNPASLGARLRQSDPDLELWRTTGIAIVLCFFVIANLAPFSEALPNSLLWLWLGVLAAPYTSVLRSRSDFAKTRAVLTLNRASARAPDVRPVYL